MPTTKRARGNPHFGQESIKSGTRFKSLGDFTEPMNKKVFGVKLPNSIAEKLLELPTEERTTLIRTAIIKYIKENL